ncbi:hypothetical protein SRB5_57000 [Streptomyces sp. RB5]|uniref:DNRLRE domain-containing protein n=1 Tax=Streptomyces smaragdinus TaxID=2585196 RepID=A0A7K0CPV9_9ACTN|nr:DNRLRE domain-containing protein [Streptomyces smaragdinus]MQY15518.1 hypothetical protein [Streptomyces smaragdinus]
MGTSRRPRPRISRGKTVLGAVIAILASGLAMPAQNATATPAADVKPASAKAKTAPTEDAAMRAAIQSDAPVEVTSLRSETSDTVANPDGTFTERQYVQPVRTYKNGRWAALDTTLVETAGGGFAPRASTTAMEFSGGGDQVLATMRKSGRTMSVGWPSELPTPTVEGDTATYPVMPDVDLVVKADVDGFSHLLVVKSAEAAADPDLAALELPVSTDGLRLEATESGGMVAEDEGAGGPVFEAPAPKMWDSSGTAPEEPSARTASDGADGGDEDSDTGDDPLDGPTEGAKVAEVGLEVGDGVMTLTPDQELLTGDDTTYPLYIDPVAKTANRTGWAMVSSHWPTNEYWKFSGDEGVGKCPADVSTKCASTSDVKRQFYSIPTASFKGKTIISAEFAITMTYVYNSTPRGVKLDWVNSGSASAINSGTNWNNQPGYKGTVGTEEPTNPAGSCTATNQNVRFNAESVVQKAASSGWDYTTFRLMASSESYEYWKRFCGNAHLEVTYNRPPNQPLMSDLVMNPGGACEYGNAGAHYTDRIPTLSAVIKDPDHHDASGSDVEMLRAQFRVWWPSDATTPGPVAWFVYARYDRLASE